MDLIFVSTGRNRKSQMTSDKKKDFLYVKCGNKNTGQLLNVYGKYSGVYPYSFLNSYSKKMLTKNKKPNHQKEDTQQIRKSSKAWKMERGWISGYRFGRKESWNPLMERQKVIRGENDKQNPQKTQEWGPRDPLRASIGEAKRLAKEKLELRSFESQLDRH